MRHTFAGLLKGRAMRHTFAGVLGSVSSIPVNQYGNVDIRYNVPDGYAHVSGLRLTIGCKKLGIECAPAMTGFVKSGGFWKAEIDGVIVATADAPKLVAYIAERDARSRKTEKSRQTRRIRAGMERERRAEELGVRSDSRTFEAYMRGDIDEAEARRVGEITRRRHEGTNYDDLLRAGYSKDEARALMEPLDGVGSVGSFSMEDLFGSQDDAPPPTRGDLFRNSRKGYEFTAGGQRWRVTRDEVGHNQRLVIEAERRDDEGSKFAEWADGVLTISPLAKRGAFRPVGRPLVTERFDGLGEMPQGTTLQDLKERAAHAAAVAEYYAARKVRSQERIWRNAAERLRRELIARLSAQGSMAGLPKRGPIPASAVTVAMKKLSRQVKKCGITKAALREGMAVEREHQDVTRGGIEKTARIAVAHLCERKDYYKRLKRYVEP